MTLIEIGSNNEVTHDLVRIADLPEARRLVAEYTVDDAEKRLMHVTSLKERKESMRISYFRLTRLAFERGAIALEAESVQRHQAYAGYLATKDIELDIQLFEVPTEPTLHSVLPELIAEDRIIFDTLKKRYGQDLAE